jgi:hypothetical protein
MHKLAGVLMVVSAIIHFIPVMGVLGQAHLVRLYGVPIVDANLLILMRHRALLFGIVGLLLLWGAFRREARDLACCVGLASAASYLVIAGVSPNMNAALRQVFWADVIVVLALIGALVIGRGRP